MQYNQPFGQPAFQSSPFNVNYPTIPVYTPIGEGEIDSIYLPDGSMQMFFIPNIRYDRWSPYANVNNFNKNKNSSEYWFVRSVTLPIATSFNNGLPNIYGERLSTQLFNPNYANDNTNLPFCPEHCQKFHNDNTTSTTDILYFYPSLRQEKTLQNSALVQTSTPAANYNISLDGINRPCNCKVSFRVENNEINGKCTCQENASCMSVDTVEEKCSQQSINKKRCQHSKHKKQSHKRKHKDHNCECNIGTKTTSDKLVTTYRDRATGNVQREGRDTQTTQKTQKSKRSDIKTEIWTPVKRKSRTKSSSSISTLNECASFIKSDCCGCASTTDTDE